MRTVLSMDTWAAVEELQRELRAADAIAPGSPRAVDLEQAISRLLDGSHEQDPPAYRRHNAVRRARYSRRRAVHQRSAAAVRLAPPPAIRTGPHLRRPAPFEPVAPDDTEAQAVAADILARVVKGARSTRYGIAVLRGLLDDRPAAEIAVRTGVSRRTVTRSIHVVRVAAAAAVAA